MTRPAPKTTNPVGRPLNVKKIIEHIEFYRMCMRKEALEFRYHTNPDRFDETPETYNIEIKMAVHHLKFAIIDRDNANRLQKKL
jgi:hypothetical protein